MVVLFPDHCLLVLSLMILDEMVYHADKMMVNLIIIHIIVQPI